MKKIIFSLLFVAVAFVVNAQVASKITPVKQVNQGEYVGFNIGLTDTLPSNDTIAFVFPVIHTNNVTLTVDQRNKLVANDTTITVSFWESMDGIKYTPVLAGSSPSAYTKTIAKSAATNVSYVGASDLDWFSMRYLKIMYISSTKSGFKKIPYGYVKFNVK